MPIFLFSIRLIFLVCLFLTSNSIIYRDLKPENIGFDVYGYTKMIDFGLARELTAKDRLDDGTYKLTGNTGTLRYMAPEGKMSFDAREQKK